jgi:hypothetical protein
VGGISRRERLRRTFDGAAEDYQQARPEYPDALYETLIALTGVEPGVDGADPFFREIQAVYDEIGEKLPDGWVFPTPSTLPDGRAEIEASGLFTDVTIRRFDWEIRYSAQGYIRLLDTFSSNLSMEPWQRDRLYGEIRRRLALRPDGQLRRHWGAVLHVARR